MLRTAVYLVLLCGAITSALGAARQTQGTPPVLKGNVPVSPVTKGGAGPLNGGAEAETKPSPTPAATAPAAKPKPPNPEDEIISVETNLVTTPVSVLDRNGRFIPGLKKKDFSVLENGVAQKITYFQSEEQPFTVVLLIDISPSTRYKIDEIHYAALTFVNQLRPLDKVMVVAFDQRIHLLTPEPTSDRQQLYAAIYKSQFGSGTSLYEAISYVTDLDMIKITGRKAIVIFTDGVDTTSRAASYESTIAAVQEVDALIYPIRYNTQIAPTGGVVSTTTGAPAQLPPDIAAMLAARGLSLDPRVVRTAARGQSPAEYERGRLYLNALAVNSGGRMFDTGSIANLETSFAGVAEELRRQYSIGYYPESPGQAGERRSLKIKVGRPNAVVRAKAGYVIRQTRSNLDRGDGSGRLAVGGKQGQ